MAWLPAVFRYDWTTSVGYDPFASFREDSTIGAWKAPTHIAVANTIASYAESTFRGAIFVSPRTSMAEEALYPHQCDAAQAFVQNGKASGVFFFPTGSGKTRLALELISTLLHESPGERIIWASYPKLLIRQGMQRFVEQGGIFPEGTRLRWAKPGDQLRDPDLLAEAEVTFLMRDGLTQLLRLGNEGSLGKTLAGKFSGAGPGVTLVYDECHQLAAAELQRELRNFLSKLDPDARARFRVLGFSATPLPSDPGRHTLLTEEIFPIRGRKSTRPNWNILVHASAEVDDLIRDGILCPLNLDLNDGGTFDIPDHVLRSAGAAAIQFNGEFSDQRALKKFSEQFNREVMSHDAVLDFIADRIVSNLNALDKTIYFAPTIAGAEKLAHMLRNRMQKDHVHVVHSDLDSNFRGSSSASGVYGEIQRFRAQKKASCIMINIGMLTTGFDDPAIRSVILGRLTFSVNLFWQMIGRGTRGTKVGGTQDCIVIDPIRLTGQHAPLEGYRPRLSPKSDDVALVAATSEGRRPTVIPARSSKSR